MSPDESLRASLEGECFVFESNWPKLRTWITRGAKALHGPGHAEMFARDLGGRTGRHHHVRAGIVDVLAQFMESMEEANLLMSVYGEEVLAGYSEVLRVLKESGGVGRLIEFGAWTGSFGRFLLGRKLAKAYVGVETADRVLALVAARRSPRAFRLRSPPDCVLKGDKADWVVCTLGLHRRSNYLFDEDDELTPLPLEYENEEVVAQAKDYYADFFASVESIVRGGAKMAIAQPVRSFAEVWGFACAARDAGWSLVAEMCRCVWGGRRFATLVLQRGTVADPMTLSDVACWWGGLVAPFSTSMIALSDVALGEYFALEDRVAIHSGQIGRSAVEVGFHKHGAYAIHSASPGGFTLFVGATESEVHSQLRAYCESRGEDLSDSPWPRQGVAPSASGIAIATSTPSGLKKPKSTLSKKAALKAQRDDLQRRVEQARVLDLDRLRNLRAVFPECLDDSLLLRMDASVLRRLRALNLLPFDESDLRRCLGETLKTLAPEKYKDTLIEEISAARAAELHALDLEELRSLHAVECGVRQEREKQPDRRTCVREVVSREAAKLKQSALRKIEGLHHGKFVPLASDQVLSRYVEILWYLDAKFYLREKAKLFDAALGSPTPRGVEIKTSLRRWLKGEEAELAKAKDTVSDPELLYEQQTVVDDLAELLIQAKGSKKGESSGRIRLSEKERAEFEERWRQDGGLSEFVDMLEYKGDLSRTENLHRCYDALHRIVEDARTNVEDWEEKFPELADLGISKEMLRIRNLVRVSGIDSDSDGKPKGEGRGVRLMQRIRLPQSDSHITAIHVVQEGLLDELGKGLDVTTIRRLLAETPTPLAWLPEFLLWRTWRRSVEQGRASVYKLRVSFDKEAGGLGVPDDAIKAVRQFLLRCEYGFIHMLNRYPDWTPVSAQVTRVLAQLPPRRKKT
ncbi:MAG: hypothetical protein K1X67_05660 [Fimbriimonadaceae bacterium]|nr:hypothetical protein [Fimbriimonadaceae bacterium]